MNFGFLNGRWNNRCNNNCNNCNCCNNNCNVCFCGCRCGYCNFPTPIFTNDCCGNNFLTVNSLNPAGSSATVVVPNIIL